MPQHLDDRIAISEVIYRFAHSLDIHDWAMCRACFTDEIETDYSDFRGEPVQNVRADDYVAKRKSALSHLNTLHVSTNHLITLNGDQAECTSNAQIYRHDPNLAQDNDYHTFGYYVHGLTRTTEGWKIHRVKQVVFWNTGNPSIHGAKR